MYMYMSAVVRTTNENAALVNYHTNLDFIITTVNYKQLPHFFIGSNFMNYVI